jgi:ATP-dependent Lon protease
MAKKNDNDPTPEPSRVEDVPRSPSVADLPLLPLRDMVVFPYMVVPLFVGRDKSIAALDRALDESKEIVLAAQKKAKTNDPASADIFEMATVASVIQLLRLPDGTVKVLVEGRRRVRIKEYLEQEALYLVRVQDVEEEADDSVEIEALVRQIKTVFENYVKLNKRIPPELLVSVQSIDDAARLADTIVGQLTLKLADKQEILETLSPQKRIERLLELMQAEIEILQMERKIRTRVKKQMEKTQKEYYLNEQMQAIQKELGERDEFKADLAELEERVRAKQMSEEATERLDKELKKLKLMSPMSAEATVVRNYIEWVLSLPWMEVSEDNEDIAAAEQVLEADHYGLQKPKERILEYLAVQSLVGEIKGPILCFVGPPGVGKTSLGRSVARATNREFVRLSLGGVRDEAEIRGHRRTYIGAMPGKITQSLKRAGKNNPVILLDEVDKLSSDFRGDPASALLEVLDPEQNHAFNDHYIDLDYDLSQVLFITTANTLHSIPPALQDRMEIIELPSYTEWEKLSIANQYLVPKQLEANGLADRLVEFSEGALRLLINNYTKEAGVRNLEREIGSICRKIAKEAVSRTTGKSDKKTGKSDKKTGKSDKKTGKSDKKTGKSDKKTAARVTARNVSGFLGPIKFRSSKKEDAAQIGLGSGLAVTHHGGELLPVEVSILPGKGKLVLTGSLGDVMQESAHAAMSYVRSRVDSFGLARDFYQRVDTHVHFPEGAIPKDGPSAGITMATALVSALLRIPVRTDVAMTGEITLRGRVLPVGGIKEKILAAHRADVTHVLIPAENQKDLHDVPKRVLSSLTIHKLQHMDEVLRYALELPEPDTFLAKPSEALDWRLALLPEQEDEDAPTPAPTQH